jgi:hypothetical protein
MKKEEEGKTKKEKVVQRDKSVFEILSTTDFSKNIIIFPLFLYAVNFIALFALDITGNHISRVTPSIVTRVRHNTVR